MTPSFTASEVDVVLGFFFVTSWMRVGVILVSCPLLGNGILHLLSSSLSNN